MRWCATLARTGTVAGRCYGAIAVSTPPSIDESLSKALAHPLRWRILEVVSEQGEASPVEIARTLDQPLATVSHHVRVLRDAHCIELKALKYYLLDYRSQWWRPELSTIIHWEPFDRNLPQ